MAAHKTPQVELPSRRSLFITSLKAQTKFETETRDCIREVLEEGIMGYSEKCYQSPEAFGEFLSHELDTGPHFADDFLQRVYEKGDAIMLMYAILILHAVEADPAFAETQRDHKRQAEAIVEARMRAMEVVTKNTAAIWNESPTAGNFLATLTDPIVAARVHKLARREMNFPRVATICNNMIMARQVHSVHGILKKSIHVEDLDKVDLILKGKLFLGKKWKMIPEELLGTHGMCINGATGLVEEAKEGVVAIPGFEQWEDDSDMPASKRKANTTAQNPTAKRRSHTNKTSLDRTGEAIAAEETTDTEDKTGLKAEGLKLSSSLEPEPEAKTRKKNAIVDGLGSTSKITPMKAAKQDIGARVGQLIATVESDYKGKISKAAMRDTLKKALKRAVELVEEDSSDDEDAVQKAYERNKK